VKRINLGIADTGEEVYIDILTLISTRMLVTASSGGGKSETLRRILEEAVGHVQCIVIDPEGEFSTLREKKPFVLVGEGGETPADIRTAALVATRLLELNASAVCDIYEMRVHERHEWVKRFLDAMVHAPKSLWHPVIVIVDEAHTYCPEHGYGESVASQAIIDLCNLGRKRGFCAILATQRLSKLSKNAAEPLQNYLVGRTTFDDQKRAAATFKIDPGAATREFSLMLERLKDGQFISRGRAITGDMLKVQVTRGETRPPKTGTAMAGVITPTPEAIKSLLPKLADLPHEAEKKAKTEDDLRRELTATANRCRELERQLAKQQQESNSDEVRMLQETLTQLKTEADEMERQLTAYQGRIKKAVEIAKSLSDVLSEPELDKVVRAFVAPMPRRAPPPVSRPQVTREPRAESNGNLRAGARRMLAVLCQWSPSGRTESQVAAQVKMKKTGGTWGAYKSDLTKGGYIEIRGDGLWYSTDAGREYLGNDIPEMPSTTEEVVALWGEKLRKGAREMLDVLVRHRGRAMDRVELGEAVGMESNGGTFGAYLSDLKQAGLILVDRDGVRANRETLFL
jgi:hypothetical protein